MTALHLDFLKKQRVLLIDDDPAFLSLIEDAIGDGFMNCFRFCADPREGVALLKNGDYTILITDTNMPVLTGIDVLKMVRADDRLRKLPVIVLFSGLFGSEMTTSDVYKAGATLVLTKPELMFKLCLNIGNHKS
jgi:DNA-binding response OmpR family regulator